MKCPECGKPEAAQYLCDNWNCPNLIQTGDKGHDRYSAAKTFITVAKDKSKAFSFTHPYPIAVPVGRHMESNVMSSESGTLLAAQNVLTKPLSITI